MTDAERQARRRAKLKNEPVPKMVHAKAAGTITLTGTATAELYRPLPDDHPIIPVLGQIALECARIEQLLDKTISRLAGLSESTGACITGQMVGPGPRFGAIIQLLKHRPLKGVSLKDWKDAKLASGRAFDKRNRALHDPWMIGETGETRQHRGRPRELPKFGLDAKTVDELTADRSALRDLRERVRHLLNCVHDALK